MSRRHARLNPRKRKRVRGQVLERDDWRCRACGKAGKLEVDHVTPLDQGGAPYDLDNLQTLCSSCHIEKTREENRARMAPTAPEVVEWRSQVQEFLDP